MINETLFAGLDPYIMRERFSMQVFSVGLAAYSINAALSFSGTVCISLHHVNPALKSPGLIYGTFLRSFMAAFRVFVRRIFFPISSWVLQIFRVVFSRFI